MPEQAATSLRKITKSRRTPPCGAFLLCRQPFPLRDAQMRLPRRLSVVLYPRIAARDCNRWAMVQASAGRPIRNSRPCRPRGVTGHHRGMARSADGRHENLNNAFRAARDGARDHWRGACSRRCNRDTRATAASHEGKTDLSAGFRVRSRGEGSRAIENHITAQHATRSRGASPRKRV